MLVQIHSPKRNHRGNPVVTFDFDETLTLPIWNARSRIWESSFTPNEHMLRELVEYLCSGWEVYVVSERRPSPVSRLEVRKFFERFKIDCLTLSPTESSDMSNRPRMLVEAIFTDGEEKVDYLNRLQSSIHFDNDQYEIDLLSEKDIVGVLVPHPTNPPVSQARRA